MSVIEQNKILETDEDVPAKVEPRLVGVVAEFDTPDQLIAASERVRDAGYTRWDTYTPFPVHGIDQAMGIRRSFLPWIVLAGGMTGTTIAILMQWYTNASEWAEFAFGWPFAGYQYPISGKPYWSLPANIPIAFELTVLLSAFCAFFGMLAINRMGRWYNPLFKVERFKKATDDKFFLSIDHSDPKFSAESVPNYLRGLGATAVDECWDSESSRLPAPFFTAALILFAIALIPPALVMHHRSAPFTTPELHPVWDMDFQTKFKSDQRNIFFDDQRAMRPQVEGTVAQGQVEGDASFYTGLASGQALASFQDDVPAEGNGEAQPADTSNEAQAEGGQEAPAAGGEGSAPADPPNGIREDQDWVESIPVAVDEKMMARGKEQFEIYCAPCHGIAGRGDGIINQRALGLRQTWIPVPSLHTPQTRNRADGYIFGAITKGVRKMPSYGNQIAPKDRWAIVLYVRALQRSQGAPAK